VVNICEDAKSPFLPGSYQMDSDQEKTTEPTTQTSDAPATSDASRRQAILKMAAYTAPVMLAVLTSEKAMAISLGGGSSSTSS
jgi:hypothetical protein